MTLRRYTTIAKSRGTVIPSEVREAVRHRDRGCVGPRVGMEGSCFGGLELDHVRGSGGIAMKSPSVVPNLVQLCSTHHRMKTNDGRKWRPVLLEYLAAR